ncbi:hypothetical protein ACMAY4_07095 [Porticoccaceae bacterium nBUS_17]
MDANSLIFGSMAVISLAVFFYLSRFKASSRQTDRDDRIDWSTRKFSILKIFLYSLGLAVGIALIVQVI